MRPAKPAAPTTRWTRFRAWFARKTRLPRRLRITREGKVFIGVTFGVGFAAVNTGNNLLYLVLGLLLSLMILSGVLSEVALRGLRFKRKLPRRSFAGASMLVEIEVHNTKRFAPSYSIEVEDRIEARRTDKRCYFLKVAPGARQTAAYRRTPPVRGLERYAALRVATRFPFGLFEKFREIELVEEQWVYPSPQRTGRLPTVANDVGDDVPREGRGRGEVDGVRELRDAEPARDIHWPKTAATNKMIARDRRRDGVQRLRLEIGNKPPSHNTANDNAKGNELAKSKDAATQTSATTAVDREFAMRLEDELRRVAWRALDALHTGAAVEIVAQEAPEGEQRVLMASPGHQSADRVLSFLARLPPDAPLPEATP